MRKLLALTIVLLLLVGLVAGPATFVGEPANDVRAEPVETGIERSGNDVSINSPISIGGS
ncbi:MAG: hypothetical protein ACLFTO_02565 [Candidatus Acetothermia bacterium]